MLNAIHAQEDRAEAAGKASTVAQRLEEMKLSAAATLVRENIEETFAYYRFPREHWRRIRTNNPMERIIREVRRRTRVVGCFPDGQSALMLVAARLRHVAGNEVGHTSILRHATVQRAGGGNQYRELKQTRRPG